MPKDSRPKTVARRAALVALCTLCAGAALGSWCATAVAEESEDTRARRANEVAHKVMSPFCPGRTLWGCPSPSAAAWRDDIRKWVDEGLSTDEIVRRLQARAPGTDLSGAPPASPLGWGLPALLGLGSLGLLVFVLRRLGVRRDDTGAEAAAAGERGPTDGDSSAGTPGLAEAESGAREPQQASDARLDARLDAELENLDD